MARLRRQHRRAQTASKRDRNRRNSFFEIRQQVSTLSLPDMIRDTACSIFRSAQNEDLLQGRSLEGFAAASVYAACRIASVSRTKAEILAASKATAAELDAAFDAINRELDIPIGPPLPIEYVPRYATELELDAQAESYARRLAIECQESGLSNGRNPAGIAAACLYTAGLEYGYAITQQDAATVADVSPVTVRKTYKRLDNVESAVDRSR